MDRRTFTKALATVPMLVAGGLVAGEAAKDARLIELGKEFLPFEQTYHAYNMDLEAQYKSGIISGEEADRRYGVLYEKMNAIVAQIDKETPETFEGLQVMARAVQWCHSGKIDFNTDTTDKRLTLSILNALTKVVVT